MSDLPRELQVPDQPRRLRFHRHQWIGLPVLFSIPLLAMLGVFGVSADRGAAATNDLSLAVDFPTRLRFKQMHPIEARVTNTSDRVLDSVVVTFDTAYVLRFSTPTFIPTPGEPFTVVLRDVKPGEVRLVWAELQGEQFGRHIGTVRAFPMDAGDTALVALHTFVFP